MSTKVYTLEEIAEHSSEDDCWLAIEGIVYDISEFLPEHPGGGDIVVDASGRDATDDFDEIGHSTIAKEMLKDYRIGVLKGVEKNAQTDSQVLPKKTAAAKVQSEQIFIKIMQILLPILILVAALIVRHVTS